MNINLLIAAHFMTGQSFFSGLFLLFSALLAKRLTAKRWVQFAANISFLFGLLCVYLSATPFPWWTYLLWTLLILACLPQFHSRPQLRLVAFSATLLFSLGMVAAEAPYHCSPAIDLRNQEAVFVLGDSLSMGAEPHGKNWPAVLEEDIRIPVHSLSFGGAKAGSIIHNADRIEGNNILVLLEIGGNDLLARDTDFNTDLDKLLAKTCQPGRNVVMFELPLPPGFNAYGRTQRRLAKQYQTTLLPKKHLAAVLSAPGATTDGLHLSPHGHRLLAEQVSKCILPPDKM